MFGGLLRSQIPPILTAVMDVLINTLIYLSAVINIHLIAIFVARLGYLGARMFGTENRQCKWKRRKIFFFVHVPLKCQY